jgi:type IV pilus assembly protein PilA
MVIRDGGFSLMELLVVLVVIATLALMAVPNFSDRIIRDQITEALPLADIAKGPIAASWATAKSFPADNVGAGLPVADKIVNNFVSSVLVRDGAIDISFGNRAHGHIKGKVLTLRAAVVDDAPVVPVTWVCGYAAAPDKMTMPGLNNTNIPANYLPLKCRQ